MSNFMNYVCIYLTDEVVHKLHRNYNTIHKAVCELMNHSTHTVLSRITAGLINFGL